MSKFIFTCQPESKDYAANEITSVFKAKLHWISGCAAIVDRPFEDMNAAFREKAPVFVRHICPVWLELSADTAPETFAAAAAELMAGSGARADSFTVQAITYDLGVRAQELVQLVTARPELSGVCITPRGAADAMSIVASPSGFFAGISALSDNISPWAGGMYRFARSDERISRAEFKLLEAFDLFGISPPEHGRALDLGAAPGGWTRVLRGRGMSVTAVDPAELDPELSLDAGVTHFRGLSQRFIEQTPRAEFDMLVNDMRMDALESAKVTVSAIPTLKEGAYVVMTLKLPTKNAYKAAKSALEYLSRHITLIAARQLFHNRSEVTALGVVSGMPFSAKKPCATMLQPF